MKGRITKAHARELLRPYAGDELLSSSQVDTILAYVELILRWNVRTNLTAVREPELILQRQVGESLFAARFLSQTGSLLDFGSGAGFPGIPLAIALPSLQVTLAESQGKKSSFLREAVRILELPCSIWAKRVEEMPKEQQYGCVALRAVDNLTAALPAALSRVADHGFLLRYLGTSVDRDVDGWRGEIESIPNSHGLLQVLHRM